MQDKAVTDVPRSSPVPCEGLSWGVLCGLALCTELPNIFVLDLDECIVEMATRKHKHGKEEQIICLRIELRFKTICADVNLKPKAKTKDENRTRGITKTTQRIFIDSGLVLPGLTAAWVVCTAVF